MTTASGSPAAGDAATPASFDITAPLPNGTTVLEASAGTGKTYAIVGLAARRVAEGMPIDQVLLVTFSRAASAELRERMRERVQGLCLALADPDTARRSPDRLERFLATGDSVEVARRRENLQRALSDFDASTIATTHTFCNRMLEALGFLGEREPVAAIVEDVDEMVAEAARDLYMDGFKDAEHPEFGFGAAEGIAKDAMRNPAAVLSPDESELSEPGSPEAEAVLRRVRFTRKVRQIVERRKRESRIRTYDDLQAILHRIVCDPEAGPDACARIREQFGVVLIGEFQDTDPQQWEIVRRCFHGHLPLVLVGDPKQSIYGFRGAEVLSYLSAVRSADQRLALDTNHRSDGDLVTALGRIYGGAQLGHPEIVAREVAAARPGSQISGAVPLRIRAVVRNDCKGRTAFGASGFPSVDYLRPRVTEDAADDIAALLGSAVTIGDDNRPVRPGDIAVLVRANKTVEPLRRALAERGIAAVVGSGASVFRTAGARHWLWMLTAIESPARTNNVRLAATTPLIGWAAATLADADDERISALAAHFAEWGRVFTEAGFSAMAARIVDQMAVASRVLAAPHGERALTDLLQVAAICNRQVMDQGWGLSELTEWLTDRVADIASHARSDDQVRRLESDAQAVQIMTVHASKGLQFPIVYLPFAWDSLHTPDDATIMYHDETGARRLDVGGKEAPGRTWRWARAHAETVAEELRLLYVAATRARSQVVMWWAPAYGTRTAPLHRLIFGRPGSSAVGGAGRPRVWEVPDAVEVPDDGAVVAGLRGVSDGALITVEPARAAHTAWTDPARDLPTGALSAARFTREIDQTWRRTSYSAITAGAHGSASPVTAGSEPDDDMRVRTDDDSEDTADPLEAPVVVAESPTASLMNGLPFGAAFGTVVHEALEYVDTSAPDIDAHVRELVSESVGAADIDIDVLTRALVGVLTTPLGFGDLWSIPTRDRLSELDFEFPLGDDVAAGFTVAAVADLLDRYLSADDPLSGYADHLRELPAQTYRGFLTGSIDSVLRRPDGRFTIVDYKTNRLRPGDLVAEDFTVEAMAAEMIANHYPLQALIYSVALHRFLRWRLPGYEPGECLGPAQYHFVRGMIGLSTPVGCGVFEWHIPAELVVALSDLIAGMEVTR